MAHYCKKCEHNMKTSSKSAEDLLTILMGATGEDGVVYCQKCGAQNRIHTAVLLAELGERIDHSDD